MHILYIGSIMSQELADQVTLHSRRKPSTAPVNFQRNLLKGFSTKDVKIDILSLPPIAMYPNSKFVGWGCKKENYSGRFYGKYIPVINLPVLKQISTFISTFFMVLGWCLKNKNKSDKCVLVYGQNVYVALPQILMCKIFGIKSCNIVTDPINYISNYDAMSRTKKVALELQWKLMNAVKCSYDSYVLLTKAMLKDYIQRGQQYIVLEGIADTSIFDNISKPIKVSPPVIMYAGALTQGFGIKTLLAAFERIQINCQLWLFGAGDCEQDIQQASTTDDRIKFWGKVPWNELLMHMQEATVMISVKPTNEFHTKYQFPSKIMEYMASETVTLSTKVEGIPDEYFNYIYPIEEDTVEGIQQSIEDILVKPVEELYEKGCKAKQFIEVYKNCFVQAQRILDLLSEVINF